MSNVLKSVLLCLRLPWFAVALCFLFVVWFFLCVLSVRWCVDFTASQESIYLSKDKVTLPFLGCVFLVLHLTFFAVIGNKRMCLKEQ